MSEKRWVQPTDIPVVHVTHSRLSAVYVDTGPMTSAYKQ